MKRVFFLAAALAACVATAYADDSKKPDDASPNFQPTEYKSNGSVTAGGTSISYDAVTGTLVVVSLVLFRLMQKSAVEQ